MPKDVWDKYRHRGRQVRASGAFFRVDKSPKPKKRKGKKRRTRSAGVTNGGYAITYDGPPETARIRYVVSGDFSQPLPPWPGFTPQAREQKQ
jgi:hypothetical protein